ncbi:MAG TPA: hypothetical protein VIV11_28995 [Kofleriaceae bacterium]
MAATNPRAVTITKSRPPLVVVESELATSASLVHDNAVPTAIHTDHPEALGPTTRFYKLAPETLEGVPLNQNERVTTPEEEWAEFKAIGLGKKQARSTRLAKLMVSTYRLLGFGILTAVVFALVGYVALTVFYLFSDTWIVPTIVSPSDEKVVTLQTELAALETERDKISDALAEADRAIAVEQQFQAKFAAAIESDLRGRRAALARARQLADAAAATRDDIRRSSEAFAASSSSRIDKQFDAGIIDRHSMLGGKQKLAEISSSNLSLAERQSAFEMQAAELSRHTKALDALLANRDVPLSYDVLKIKRDYDASKLAVEKAVETRKTLLASLSRQDKNIANLQSSAYLRALRDKATVALVPYSNLANVKPGTALYGCALEMLLCRQVGRVIEVLPGEVQFKHPNRDKLVRGQLVELRLDVASAAQDDVLFAGGSPLWL